MFDVWSAVGWWDRWQLRILVLGSLGIQWFLMVAAPMRKYTVRRSFRLCIWLAYISSDAVAIYALATLFNRHARATSSSSSCDGIAHNKAKILEVLWAPVLLIHLGGQEELTAYTIEDNELWTRHTVTLVSQVAVAMYAFYKSWPNPGDWKLLASAVLLFVIGVVSFSEKPWALKKASINRLASVSATIQGTQKRTRLAVYLDDLLFSDWYNCSTTKSGEKSSLLAGVGWHNCFSFTESATKKQQTEPEAGEEDNVGLSDGDKVYMVLSDMSLSAAADDLVQRGRARNVRDVLRPLSTKAEKELKRWLRGAFGLIYTRANLVFTRKYLVYHVLVVPILHIAALTLFAMSGKDGYNRTDMKITYILLCLTAALDVFAVFIRQLLYRAMSAKSVPALCETVPGYNLVDAVLRRRHKDIGWLVKCATRMGCKEECFDYCKCEGGGQDYTLYKNVSQMVLADLVDTKDRDLANYRVFTVPEESLPVEDAEAGAEIMQQSSPGVANWALSEELQRVCGPKVRGALRGSFDRSVLVWHIATDLCFRMEDTPPPNYEEDPHWLRIKCTEAISSYMARLLNFHPDMLLTGSRQHLVSEAKDEFEFFLNLAMVGNSGKPLSKDDLTNIIDHGPERERFRMQVPIGIDNEAQDKEVIRSLFHVPKACSLAKELLKLEPPSTRWRVMYRVWLGMLFYSASMCRGYLHAKSLGEGGEFLSYVWLVLSLKGAKTLADKLQMLKGDDEEPTPADKPQILEGPEPRNQQPDRCPQLPGLEIPRPDA
ncbi:hypothetical protein CFC21_107898 [Triticum aestivum]|uniref:DUF4220 domain-containing protein n=2 Tax=Triticum aestivum TaxID=4565 RepID=A0A3B6TL39_WHEAT|nr:uncharacterized protein LOC123171019 [Triticum aestivum]KAF7107245.1 hypothetical protein CFC21_107898 [Triticum aestivum]